jgi:MFS family permease
MQRTAQAWLVLDLTGSAFALGIVTVLQFLPVLLLSLFAGVVVDRFPKRRVLLVTQSVQMLQALVLGALVVFGQVQIWQVYVLAAVQGLAQSVDQPARRAITSELVGRDLLPSAVALDSTLFNSARIIGPSLGGLAIITIGVGGCFVLNGLSFVAVLVALVLLRSTEMHLAAAGPRGSVAGRVLEGLRYAGGTPRVAFTLLLLGLLGTFGFNFNVMLPLLARYTLDAGALGFGGLNSALGLGAVVGSIAVASRGHPTRQRIAVAASVFSVLLLVLAFSPAYLTSVALLFLAGIASVTFSTSASTSLQLAVPPGLLGRVMGLYSVVFVGATPIGAALTGGLAERWGPRTAIGVDAVCCLVGLAAATLLVRATAD